MAVNYTIEMTGSIVDRGLKWADALAESGDTIVSSTWELLHGAIELNDTIALVGDLPGHTHGETSTLVWFKPLPGAEGTTAQIKNVITTSSGREIPDVMVIHILDHLNPQTVVPPGRVIRLVRTDAGLVGEMAITLPVGLWTTIAVEFECDLPVRGRVAEVEESAIVEGTPGGIEFGATTQYRSQGILRIRPTTMGSYKVAVDALYETPVDKEDHGQGVIEINAA